MTSVGLARLPSSLVGAPGRRCWLAYLTCLPLAVLIGLVVSTLGAAGLLLLAAAALTALLLASPIAALGLLLAIGGVDLSFATGGQKVPLLGSIGVDLSGIRLMTSVAGMALLILANSRPARRIPWRWVVLFLAFLTYSAATLVWSPSRVDGLRLLLKVSYPILMFLAVLVTACSQRDVDRLLAASLLGGFMVAGILNPILHLGGWFDRDISGVERLRGGGLHENPASFYMLVLVLLVVARFRREQALLRVTLALAFAASMVLSYTRITVLVMIPALLVMELAAVRRRGGASRRWLASATVGLVLIAAAPTLAERSSVTNGGRLSTALDGSRTDNLVGALAVFNLSGRDVVWGIIWDQFTEQPITGAGLGATVDRLLHFFPPDEVGAPHNEYLRFLAETGLVGTGLLIAAFGGWWWAAVRVLRSSASRNQQDLARVALASLVVLALTSASDNSFDYYGPLTQFVALFVAGSLIQADAGPGPSVRALGAETRG